jgi:glycosyltransferase involved in cell wall biosynthesis
VQEGAVKRVPGKPVFCIPNGVEIPGEAELAERRGWESPLRLLFAGRLIDSHKGIFRLPPILAECRRRGLPVVLTVIGEGEDGKRLERRFAADGLADKVTMSGRLPPSEIARAMRDHHVFLFPTNTEGMPLALLEAQANGCVVIGTHLPGITDVAIEDGVTGRLFGMGDIAGCVDDIRDLMVPEVWNSHSVAGIARSRNLFSIPAMGKRYAELLDELSEGRYPSNRRQGRGSAPLVWDDYLPMQLVPLPVMRIAGKARAAVRRLTGIRQGSR